MPISESLRFAAAVHRKLRAIAAVLRDLDSVADRDRYRLISFEEALLAAVRDQAPSARLGLLAARVREVALSVGARLGLREPRTAGQSARRHPVVRPVRVPHRRGRGPI